MQCFFVVDGDFFAGMNIPQGEEQYVAVQIFHVGVRLATVIDVMRAVASACAVQTATAIDVADAQDSAVATALRSFEIRDAFARVLRDLFSARKKDGGKATSAVDARRFDRETGCKSSLHQTAFYDRSPSGARFEIQSLRTRKILNESYLCSGSALNVLLRRASGARRGSANHNLSYNFFRRKNWERADYRIGLDQHARRNFKPRNRENQRLQADAGHEGQRGGNYRLRQIGNSALNCAQTNRTVFGDDRSITASIKSDTEPAFVSGDQRFSLGPGHAGEIVDVQVARPTEAHPFRADHLFPISLARRGDLYLLQWILEPGH